ncbi:SPOR domain-containing protein [Aurantiacibacter sp. D1-12]|uniref:SPOR domain-containing protein n=1 Tax=Aurantiacibacter sp. D1-12 TaxID=2993658 RepID=UPI00237C5A32|nr:SPOR domain-containing protein [Aurantiacibacter sp. D1-12]MDE1467001.1 SPOR domain-containing protein [Aurantiacibacter sp. D1-12]
MIHPGDEDENLEAGEELEQAWEEDGQLALADEDEDLPWLEADEYEEEGSFDVRLIVLALVGLLVVAALLAAAWWFTRDTPDAEMVPDGSTVEAPEGAYKERPEDPGGQDVAGTGDQAFEVAEGESTRGRIDTNDGGDSDPAPSIDVAQSGGEGSGGEGASEPSGAAYVQIAAYSSREEANNGWRDQSSRFSALSGLRHRVIEAEVNSNTVYRLQAVASSTAEAERICRSIRSSGGDCYVR